MISEHRKQNHMQPATFYWIYTAHPINKIDFRIYVLQVSLYFVLQNVRKGDITREKLKCQGMIKGWADFWALANWQSHDFCKYTGQKRAWLNNFQIAATYDWFFKTDLKNVITVLAGIWDLGYYKSKVEKCSTLTNNEPTWLKCLSHTRWQ